MEKPIVEFYTHPAMGDGHLNKCKECTKKDAREVRSRRIDYYRAYDRERALIPERAKTAQAISVLWRRADKRRTKCHDAVARALRSGKLIRAPCERCGCEKSLAHHESYDRPLDVKWLCQPCHKQRHKEMVMEGIDL
jgi:hypothetical protein